LLVTGPFLPGLPALRYVSPVERLWFCDCTLPSRDTCGFPNPPPVRQHHRLPAGSTCRCTLPRRAPQHRLPVWFPTTAPQAWAGRQRQPVRAPRPTPDANRRFNACPTCLTCDALPQRHLAAAVPQPACPVTYRYPRLPATWRLLAVFRRLYRYRYRLSYPLPCQQHTAQFPHRLRLGPPPSCGRPLGVNLTAVGRHHPAHRRAAVFPFSTPNRAPPPIPSHLPANHRTANTTALPRLPATTITDRVCADMGATLPDLAVGGRCRHGDLRACSPPLRAPTPPPHHHTWPPLPWADHHHATTTPMRTATTTGCLVWCPAGRCLPQFLLHPAARPYPRTLPVRSCMPRTTLPLPSRWWATARQFTHLLWPLPPFDAPLHLPRYALHTTPAPPTPCRSRRGYRTRFQGKRRCLGAMTATCRCRCLRCPTVTATLLPAFYTAYLTIPPGRCHCIPRCHAAATCYRTTLRLPQRHLHTAATDCHHLPPAPPAFRLPPPATRPHHRILAFGYLPLPPATIPFVAFCTHRPPHVCYPHGFYVLLCTTTVNIHVPVPTPPHYRAPRRLRLVSAGHLHRLPPLPTQH